LREKVTATEADYKATDGWLVCYTSQVADGSAHPQHCIQWHHCEATARKMFAVYAAPYASGPIRYTQVYLSKIVKESE
jgi:hypothetical protein